jgi:cell division septum initiation protein DivIVA
VATEEPELTALRPGDIEGQRFSVGEGGYSPGEVHRFLETLAEHVGRLQGEIEWQRARVEHLEQRSLAAQESAYDRLSHRFMEVVRRADEAAMEVRTRAEDEARAALDGAREDADRMVALAAGEAERILLTARSEAERLVADATGQVERLVRAEAMRRQPTWPESEREPDRSLEPAVVRHVSNGHNASSDHFGAGRGQVSPRSPVEPEFQGFEDLDLGFDGSMFDLLDEAGS